MKILVSIPTVGSIAAEAVDCLMGLSYECGKMEAEGHKFLLSVAPRMMVPVAREEAARVAVEENCDYLFFMDDDHLFRSDILRRLMKHDKDIVGALTFERMGDHNPNAYMMTYKEINEEGGNVTGRFRYSNIADYEAKRDENGLIECDAVGFGAVLIKVDVLRKMDTPRFMSQFNIGEDFFFCYKAKEKGFKVFMDCHPDTIMAHMAEPRVVTEVDFKRIWNMKQQVMEKTAELDIKR